MAPWFPPRRDRQRLLHPAGGTAAAEERDTGLRAARGRVGRPRWVLRPPSPCSEGAGSIDPMGRAPCTARSSVGPLGAAGARDVPAKSFYPLRNKGSFCILLGVQPSPEEGRGRSPWSRAQSECPWDRSIQPETPPAGKSLVPAPLLGVTPAPSPRGCWHRRRAEGLVLRGHARERKIFEQERFLSQGFSFSKSSFEGGSLE